MKSIQSASAYILVGLGLIHTLLTPLFAPGFNTGALWFAGTGLGFLFLGLLNLASVRAPSRVLSNLCLVANAIGVGYGILVVLILMAPQAFLALLALVAALLGCLLTKRSWMESAK
jgi:hypothetical protein